MDGTRYNQRQMPSVGVAYTPHYNPEFFQAADKMLEQSQQDHDVAVTAQAAEMSKRNEIFSHDPKMKDQVMNRYREDLKAIIDSYGGDVGAARNKIVERMGAESANPFWNANKYQQEQAAISQKLKLEYGPDAIVLKNPTTPGSLGRAVAGDMSAVETDIIKSSNYIGIAAELGRDIGPLLKSLNIEQSEWEDYLRDGTIEWTDDPRLKQLAAEVLPAFRAAASTWNVDNRPEYQFLKDDQATIDFIRSVWSGKQVERTKWNHFESAASRRRGKEGEEESPLPTGNVYQEDTEFTASRLEIDKKYTPYKPDKPTKKLGHARSEHVGPDASQALDRMHKGAGAGNPNELDKVEQWYKDFEAANPAYRELIKMGINREDAVDLLHREALRYNGVVQTSYEFHNEEVSSQIVNNIVLTPNESLKAEVRGPGGDKVKLEQFKKDIEKAKISSARVLSAAGEIELGYVLNGKTYKARIFDANFDVATKGFLTSAKEFFKSIYDMDQPLGLERDIRFPHDDNTYVVVNTFLETTPPFYGAAPDRKIEVRIRRKNDTSSDPWRPADEFTGEFGQEVRNSIIANKSLRIKIDPYNFKIWK
jgi:hypothetical protein